MIQKTPRAVAVKRTRRPRRFVKKILTAMSIIIVIIDIFE